MERREKGLMVEKLKGKRGGPSTPPPTWRLEFPSQLNENNRKQVQEFLNFPTSTTLSARSLCAKLWQIQQLAEPSPTHRPASATGLRRHVQTSLVQHHRSVKRNGRTKQPVSPPTQVAPYNNHVKPKSSLDLKGWITESSRKPKTSRELLNRIWCLEEQHASNISEVKALKMELDLSRARVKELQHQKQLNKHEMENLMKQITEEKLVRKNKEHDEIKAAIQSVMQEIEDERRLRKHSESQHRRLARELSEVKSSFNGSLRDLEKERKARILLENLCDDFAKGIRDYEHEVRSLVHNNNAEKGQGKEDNSLDRLILHLSEAWLDERKQMKLVQAGNGLPQIDSSIVDKLGVDIETFLHAKRSVNLIRYGNTTTKEPKEIYPCLHSPLKEATSAPPNMAVEDSTGTNIFEQRRPSDKFGFKVNRNNTAEVHKEKKGRQNSVRKQVESKEECFELQANMICDENESWFVERKSSEVGGDSTVLYNTPGASTVCEGPTESNTLWTKRMNSSLNIVRNSSLSSEGNDKVYPESIFREDSCVHAAVTGNGSPVKKWKPTLIVPDFGKSDPLKDNTLMAKLLEARLEKHKSRSRATIRQVSDEKHRNVSR
ncbi:uncharacterized protein At5g41620 [Cajanus cajan]|uniref:uncharacterized protein At5g41620 n=1 Tax=Cajanus cajan TaxID=3821 RepID=UPI00098D862D|nr:uncharacterized protein At5g41620 [Cajanus cajan]